MPALARIRRLGLALTLGLVLATGADAELALEPVTVETGQGAVTFAAEVADDPQERAKGLMFREHLDQGRGMLFDFGETRNVTMWMQNTFLPLDMVFIAKDGHVLFIAENTVPKSQAVIGPVPETRAVLEVNAGTARRIGLEVGDRVRHRLFAP